MRGTSSWLTAGDLELPGLLELTCRGLELDSLLKLGDQERRDATLGSRLTPLLLSVVRAASSV